MYCVNSLVELYKIVDSNLVIVFRGDKRLVYQNLSPLDTINFETIFNGDGIVEETSEIVLWLLQNNFISESENISSFINSKYNRQISAYSFITNLDNALKIQSDISKLCFLIIGVGGIGTNTIQQLVRIGVEKFILIDTDIVEKSNLNRQVLFNYNDIGKKKIVAAKDAILNFNPKSTIEIFDINALNKESLPLIAELSFDFAIISADSNPLEIHRKYSKFFYQKEIPYAFIGYLGLTAKIGPLILNSKSCCGCCINERFNYLNYTEIVSYKNHLNISPSSIQINTIASSIFIDELSKFYCNKDTYTNKVIYFNLETLTIEIEDIKRKEICKLNKSYS